MRRFRLFALLAVMLLAFLFWRSEREQEARADVAEMRAKKKAPRRLNVDRPRALRPDVSSVVREDTGALIEDRVTARVHFELEGGELLPPMPVLMQGCGILQEVDSRSSGLDVFLAEAATCSLVGYVPDGLLMRRSAPVEIEPGLTDDVTLVFPEERTGGVGLSLDWQPHPEGVRIADVIDGSPASEMGLRAGDVVVEVEGKMATDISLDEFVATMTGPEGTDVEFVLLLPSDTGIVLETVRVARRFLGS